MEIKKFNIKWKGKQLDRTILEISKEKAREYMLKKYPNRIIELIEEY